MSLIGAAAAYSFSIAMGKDTSNNDIHEVHTGLTSAKPTAVNLEWTYRIVAEKLEAAPIIDRLDIS